MANKIHYFNTSTQFKKIQKEVSSSVTKVLTSGKYILGDDVTSFENNFATFSGAKYGVGVGSGTDALIFALKALGIGKGDQVILPSFTFVATMFSVMHVGAEPVFADVDPATYTMDPKDVQKRITKKTKALLPVHLYGQCANMSPLQKLARKHKLFLVEDSAQAHGAKFNHKIAGSMGDAGCFSFYPTKNLGACGDGGIVLSKHKSVIANVKRFRNLGRSDLKDHQDAAWTSRLDTLQAAILSIKLKHLEEYNKNRRKIAALYKTELCDLPIVLPEEAEGRYHVYHLFVALIPGGKRDKLRKFLTKNGIPSMVHYQKACHLQPAYTKIYSKKWKLPVTAALSKQIISLPMYPEMPKKDVLMVCAQIRKFYEA